jgi:hypothetical protein
MLSRYRPRVLTLCLVCVVAALITLANFNVEATPRRAPPPKSPQDFDLTEPDEAYRERWPQGWPLRNLSYGWPLRWGQYVFIGSFRPDLIFGECSSTGRLVADVAIWLAMLIAPAAACEWLVRRFRPRPNWSLRTMLAGMGIIGCGLGWFASARSVADLQDAIIHRADDVWVEHRGPEWVEAIEAGRYRRFIIGASADIGNFPPDEEERQGNQQFLKRLGALHYLRYLKLDNMTLTGEIATSLKPMRQLRMLDIDIDHVVPGALPALIDSLRSLPELRILCVSGDDDIEDTSGLFAAIGKVTQLERLRIAGMILRCKDLDCLAGLTNLKSLSLENVAKDVVDRDNRQPLLSRLPALPRLEAMHVWGAEIYDDDLNCLARLPNLKIITVDSPHCTPSGLSSLASLEFLEELSIGYRLISAAGIESLRASRRLKELHVEGYFQGTIGLDYLGPDMVEDCLQAIASLSRSKPDIAIDGFQYKHFETEEETVLPERKVSYYEEISNWRETVRQWKAGSVSRRVPLASGPAP